MRRPRILIGSSAERLDHASALQKLLEHSFEVTIWNQAVFKPTEYTIEGLERIAREVDYGVFIFSDEDVVLSRGARVASPRDNVLFECGFFFGLVGRSRSIIVRPRGIEVKLPTDLIGITPVNYDPNRADGNLEAGFGGAAYDIKNWILGHTRVRSNQGFVSVNTFNNYSEDFSRLIESAKREMIVLFIHSRRWRENNDTQLKKFLREGGHLSIYLPDPSNKKLMSLLNQRFDDGSFVGAGLEDAHSYFGKLKQLHGSRVQIYRFSFPPSYSLYIFDDDVLVSFYPNSAVRQPTPTLHLKRGTYLTDFFERDLESIRAKLDKTAS